MFDGRVHAASRKVGVPSALNWSDGGEVKSGWRLRVFLPITTRGRARLRREWSPEELIACWTLVDNDWELLGNKTGATRLGFGLLLKFFELEARFPRTPARCRRPRSTTWPSRSRQPDETVRRALYPVVGEGTLRDLVREAMANQTAFRQRVRIVLPLLRPLPPPADAAVGNAGVPARTTASTGR